MSIKSNLTTLKANIQAAKDKLYTNLTEKGVTDITTASTLDAMADSVNSITTSGSNHKVILDEVTNNEWYLQPRDLKEIYFNYINGNMYPTCSYNFLYAYGDYYVADKEYQHYCYDGNEFTNQKTQYGDDLINYIIPINELIRYNLKYNYGNDAMILEGIPKNCSISECNNKLFDNSESILYYNSSCEIKIFDEYDSETYITNPLTYEEYSRLYKCVKKIPYILQIDEYNIKSVGETVVGCNFILNDGGKYIKTTKIDDNTILIEQGYNASEYNMTFNEASYYNLFFENQYYDNIQYKPSVLNGNSNEVWCFPFGGENKYFVKVVEPDEILTTTNSMFSNCKCIAILDLSSLDTSNVVTMYNMFSNCKNLTSLDLSSFDTSNVTTMQFMFRYCYSLTSLDLSSFDTSNVTNMQNIFGYCTNLTSLDLSNWDTSKVTEMSYMFSNCSKLTSLDLSSFDTSKVTSMNGMFNYCYILTELHWNNFGNGSGYTAVSFSNSSKLGVNTTDYPNARQSLVDMLATNSFDRASNGYSTCTITLHANTKAVLTSDEIAQITAKGFTIA